jgi:hypothetical protein
VRLKGPRDGSILRRTQVISDQNAAHLLVNGSLVMGKKVEHCSECFELLRWKASCVTDT